jgi:hypothetical protein
VERTTGRDAGRWKKLKAGIGRPSYDFPSLAAS